MELKWKHFIIPTLIALIGVIIGSIGTIDLTIAQNTFFYRNAFSLIFATFAIIPVYGLLSFFGVYLIALALKAEKRLLLLIIFIAFGVGMFGFGVYKITDDFSSINGFNIPNLKWPLVFPISLFVFSVIGHFGFKYGKHSNNEHQLYGLFLVLVLCVAMVGLALLIKSIMARPRFRGIVESGNQIPFYKWYQRNPNKKLYMETYNLISEEFKSFPSGHASFSMFLTFGITLFPALGIKKIKNITLAYYICYIWAVLIALSRILTGAHFLSDVSFGMLMTCVLFIIIKLVLGKWKVLSITTAVPETKKK